MNPMNKNHKEPQELDLTKPRLALYKQKWKVHQDTVFWVETQLAQRKGLKFYQTRCNVIILYDTHLAYCISKVVVMESGENHMRESICVTSATSNGFLQKYLDERIGFRSSWKQQGHATNPTKSKNPIIKNGETRG